MLSSLKKFKGHLSVTISGDSIQSSITREHIKQQKEKYNLGNNHYFSSTGEYVKCFFFFFGCSRWPGRGGGKAMEEIERETCKDKKKETCSGERKSTI